MKLLLIFLIALIALTGCVSQGFDEGIRKLNSIDSKYGVSQGNIAPASLEQINGYREELNSYKAELQSNPFSSEKEKIIELIDLRLEMNELQENNLKAIQLIDSGQACQSLQFFEKAESNATETETKVNSLRQRHSDLSLSGYFSNVLEIIKIVKQENSNLISLLEQNC